MAKTLEERLIEVIVLESSPPVQDSAKEIFNFFFVKILINLLALFFIKIIQKKGE